MRLRLCCHCLVFLALLSEAAAKCERLKASLTYPQDEAPRDLSGVLPVVVEKINNVLEGVVDVEVEWTGLDLQGAVGEHMIMARVTRLAKATAASSAEIIEDEYGRDLVTECYHVPFDILDIDECRLPTRHPMRHQCHSSAICVNTVGAYECVCPRTDEHDRNFLVDTATESFWRALEAQERGPWEVSLATSHYCAKLASTHGCCPTLLTKGDAAQCRKKFFCPVDPCSNDDCDDKATCSKKDNPIERPNYLCQCPEGLMGNGQRCLPSDPKPEPKVKYDGKTPTEKTLQNNYYCGCTKPIIDPCDGFPPCTAKHEVCTVMADKRPKCACKKGYVPHETYGCVDESPPNLTLKHDPNRDGTLRLKQGDSYKEYAVEIKDENAEEYLRSLKIAYSEPLPNGCLTKTGEFNVNYTVETPWTVPPFQRVTRHVVIEDIDECKLDVARYERQCPPLVPRCDTDAGAKCVNTDGSYTCRCPKHTTGDGFQRGVSFGPSKAPEGFKGGQSCTDTGKPVIQLQGPNPKVFRVCGCGGINGIMNQKVEHDVALKTSQQSHYESDILSLIQMTGGAELCATHSNSAPKASDCAIAYDDTYKGRVDLSKKVVVGKPVRKSPTRWSVPYDVTDEAGNEAVTVWRDVLVEEVDLANVEARIRKEVMQDKQREIEAAVAKALADDARGGRRKNNQCPTCPPCDCSGNADFSTCENVCADRGFPQATTTTFSSYLISTIVEMIDAWTGQRSPVLATGMLVVVLAFGMYLVLLVFSQYGTSARQLRVNSGSYPRDLFDDDARTTPRYPEQPYPNIFQGSANGRSTGMNGRTPTRREEVSVDDIFLRTPQKIISPSKTGDGVHMRS